MFKNSREIDFESCLNLQMVRIQDPKNTFYMPGNEDD